MRMLADSCPSGPCPKIVDLENGEVTVQGYDVEAVQVPSGESVVRIPAALLLQAADALRAGVGA